MTQTSSSALLQPGTSFRARVYLLQGDRALPLRFSRTQDKFGWGIAPAYDWLQAGGDEWPPVLQFTYVSHTEDRWHYRISGTGPRARGQLGISRNGYLGLYERAEVTDDWKIEPLEVIDGRLICRWRDHLGHQVKAEPDTPHHQPGQFYSLTVGEGELHEYLIEEVV
ncbi:hypothetical protein [Pseudomonas alabamensis]|uniref:hypothetical protein n=1 Tax=Pseudomonas alabamensis TaxID=3064349 RepID=UPI0021D9CBA1|nr:hypothetical protein [Pseudomonas entomophila]